MFTENRMGRGLPKESYRWVLVLTETRHSNLLEQGFSKCGKVSLRSENIRTAASPLPIIIAIIIIIVVAIMQGYYYPVECPYLLA